MNKNELKESLTAILKDMIAFHDTEATALLKEHTSDGKEADRIRYVEHQTYVNAYQKCISFINRLDFMPKDFDEAVTFLVEQKAPVDHPFFHFCGGMAMRNDWGLWHNKTPIAKWFTAKEVYHGDDRSGMLCKAVEAKIKGEPFDIDYWCKYYQQWWEKQYGSEHSLENMRKEFFESNNI